MSLYCHFVKNISFPLLTRRFGLSGLIGHIDSLDKSQFWSRNKIEVLQLERLRTLLLHAYNSTSYYRKIFDEVSFKPESITNFDEIKTLPLLTKDIIRDKGDDLLSTDYTSEQVHFSETGGTTGVKMKFWRVRRQCPCQ